MAVTVPLSRGNHRRFGRDPLQKAQRGSCLSAVVTDLQQVRGQVSRHFEKFRFAFPFQIAGKKRPERSIRNLQNRACVVPAEAFVFRRPQDLAGPFPAFDFPSARNFYGSCPITPGEFQNAVPQPRASGVRAVKNRIDGNRTVSFQKPAGMVAVPMAHKRPVQTLDPEFSQRDPKVRGIVSKVVQIEIPVRGAEVEKDGKPLADIQKVDFRHTGIRAFGSEIGGAAERPAKDEPGKKSKNGRFHEFLLEKPPI